MTVAQFSTALAKLHGAIESLERIWNDTRQHWDDETCRNFDISQVQPLLQQSNRMIEATVPLCEGMTKARRDCEPTSMT